VPERTPLAEWVADQIGKGRRFKSERQLSLAAGLTQNGVNNLIANGKADPPTLVKLAAALDVSPMRLFVLADWLPEPEAEAELAPDERELLEHFRSLEPADRRLFLEMSRLSARGSGAIAAEKAEARRQRAG
jgi:hypothetical protein